MEPREAGRWKRERKTSGTNTYGRQAMIEVLPITDEVTEMMMRRDLTSIEIANFIYNQYHEPSLRTLAFELLYQGTIDLPSAADSVRLGLISERDKKWQPT